MGQCSKARGGHRRAPPYCPPVLARPQQRLTQELSPDTLKKEKKFCGHDFILLLLNAFRRTKVSNARMYKCLGVLTEGGRAKGSVT